MAHKCSLIYIGAGSVKLHIFSDGCLWSVPFDALKEECGLGEGMQETGRLSEDGKRRVLKVVRRFARRAAGTEGVVTLNVLGGSIFLDAADGAAFRREIAEQLGLQVQIVTAREKALFAAQGVLMGDPAADGLVANLGRATLEIVDLMRPETRASAPLGTQALRGLGRAEAREQIERSVRQAACALDGSPISPPGRTLHVAGGTFRAVMRVVMTKEAYPLDVQQGYPLRGEQAAEAAARVARLSPSKIRELIGCSQNRAEAVPVAALVLADVIRNVRPAAVKLSAYGMREGVFAQQMQSAARDPFLQACFDEEARAGRRPGLGSERWRWLAPAFPEFNAYDGRLALAACLLADQDVGQSAKVRERSAINWVERDDLAAVDHPGRVFLGLTLLHRLKNGDARAERWAARKLLSAKRCGWARALGRALRLADEVAGAASGHWEHARLERDKTGVFLRVAASAEELATSTVRKRLKALASALSAPRFEVSTG